MSLIILLYFLLPQHVSGIVMPERCWAYKKYNKIISDIQLVFYSSLVSLFEILRRWKFSNPRTHDKKKLKANKSHWRVCSSPAVYDTCLLKQMYQKKFHLMLSEDTRLSMLLFQFKMNVTYQFSYKAKVDIIFPFFLKFPMCLPTSSSLNVLTIFSDAFELWS